MNVEVSGTNFWKGRLPLGCQYCREGAKMVLYVTGLCQSHCYYCPVGRDRMYVDVTYANERRVDPDDVDAILAEARAMNAKGAGITGGDPMTVPERVVRYCSALKQAFGPSFHTHLYTQNVFDPAWLLRLHDGGLDEIRFHPPTAWWDKMENSPYDPLIRAALETPLRVGCEVPAIPGKEPALARLAEYLDRLGVAFLNLNELEFSEANVDQLVSRGYEFLNDSSNVVAGSRETAWNVVQAGHRRKLRTTVHFCASTYKDSVQLRKRLMRRAETVERPFDVSTDDGTLLFGVIEAPAIELESLFERLTTEFAAPLDLVQINRARSRIELAPWILEEIFDRAAAPGTAFIVEIMPTDARMEVERTPLPDLGDDWDDDEDDEDDTDDVVDPDEQSRPVLVARV